MKCVKFIKKNVLLLAFRSFYLLFIRIHVLYSINSKVIVRRDQVERNEPEGKKNVQ